jgi:hypothetical protein
MGFLDHSTNNIIIDAVLTDTGRAFLARNDGSFSIVKFAFGDDEVDYSIIQKFGRTVGKEKVEKNTPIFEAQTNASLGLKNRLISVSNPNLIRLPSFTLSGDGLNSAGTSLAMTRSGAGSARSLTLTQDVQNETTIDVELRDQAFIIEVPNRFLQLRGLTPDNVDSDSIATYIVTRDPNTTAIGGSRLTAEVETKSITDAQFLVYGNASDKNTISTVLRISGIQSGAVKEFEVTVTK